MEKETVYKIKDSVDLFLSNNKYLMVYYMNTRQRRSFEINDEMIYLIENIDGEKSLQDLINIMTLKYGISEHSVVKAIEYMLETRILTSVVKKQSILKEEYVKKFSRQINYFSEFLEGEYEALVAQRKIMETKVSIFGCGAIGGNIALELAMAGVGKMILYDFDHVEISDISRHMFYRSEYIGMPKVDVLRNELKKINPEIQVETIFDSMKPDSSIENIISESDFVINTMDEPYIGYTAAKISRICIKNNIPHFIAGGFDAHLASTGELIIPYITPCVECYASHFKSTLKNWKPKSHPVLNRELEIGGLASMSLFSTSYACLEIIKYIAGLVHMRENFKIRGEFLFSDMSLTYLNVEKKNNCPICGGTSHEA